MIVADRETAVTSQFVVIVKMRDNASDLPKTTTRNTTARTAMQGTTPALTTTTASSVERGGSCHVDMLDPTASNCQYLDVYHLSVYTSVEGGLHGHLCATRHTLLAGLREEWMLDHKNLKHPARKLLLMKIVTILFDCSK